MNSNQIRQRFLDFFQNRGHAILPSSSLVPENDPSVLFNTAGMQPLVPYLLGKEHPKGTRLADVQKCVRTGDIEEIGDKTHFTFFEMLGNWSLGDYFKEDAIKWSFQFLTSKEDGLGLDPSRLYATVFEGDENAPKDEVSYKIWEEIFQSAGLDPQERIFFMSAKSNWWSPGDNGPCGPDSEMFYDRTEAGLGGLSKEQFIEADDRQDIVEIWNDVFMEYLKKDGKVVGKLEKQNVDTGAGLERITAIMQGKETPYETDLFEDVISIINSLAKTDDVKLKRIIADHTRTSIFLISDGVFPSNTDQGYILRRLLRRAIRFADNLGIPEGSLLKLIDPIISKYQDVYPNLKERADIIKETIAGEEEKFRKTLKTGLKEFEKFSADGELSGEDAFVLFSTYGFPFEMTKELALEKNVRIDEEGFNAKMKEHQELSRTASAGKFKGGLGGDTPQHIAYHTATHLLHQALRDVLGEHVEQRGSNITADRMRFDFSHPDKMTDDQKKRVEDIVNEQIKKNHKVSFEEMTLQEAKDSGAIGIFEDKYGDKVSVYTVGDYSKEICGGPHVEHTGVMGHFKITKEEASSAGIRRIKAILE